MNFLQKIYHSFKRLNKEEKMIAVGSLVGIVSCFCPWYSVTQVFGDITDTNVGFGGEAYLIGYLIFIFSLVALLIVLSDSLKIRLPKFSFSYSQLLTFLGGEAIFLILIALSIYTRKAFSVTMAEVRFGLYTALAGAIIYTLGGYFLLQKEKKKSAEDFFQKPGETPLVHLEPEEINTEEIMESREIKEEIKMDIKE